ncbi:tetratricopeptide repeat protein [Flavobacterium procerum]|uniref:Tetratricopeptide repeat protein n=1 Tax=Flavobacterium procerum TaxID=1455569 RepID=A0ABV6BTL7_9FLAO
MMKNDTVFWIPITLVFSLGSFAQLIPNTTAFPASGNTVLLTDSLAEAEKQVITAYYVEERINKLFGGTITTYVVSKLEMIYTNDLGPNNTRTIIPKYAKPKQKIISDVIEAKAPNAILPAFPKAEKDIKVASPEASSKYIEVDLIKTYEQVVDKGYQSPEMLRKVADRLYFEGNLKVAAKYYQQLFDSSNTELESIYFYRYAQSLRANGEFEKADKLMKRFRSENL